MKKLTFYGASDDLLEVEGPGGGEWPADSEGGGTFRLALPDGRGIGVGLQYGASGCWNITIATLMDDPDDVRSQMPEHWKLTLSQEPATNGHIPIYTMVLEVECDDEAVLTFVSRDPS